MTLVEFMIRDGKLLTNAHCLQHDTPVYFFFFFFSTFLIKLKLREGEMIESSIWLRLVLPSIYHSYFQYIYVCVFNIWTIHLILLQSAFTFCYVQVWPKGLDTKSSPQHMGKAFSFITQFNKVLTCSKFTTFFLHISRRLNLIENLAWQCPPFVLTY